MQTIWRYSSKTEVLRIIETAYEIATGFYRHNNFPLIFYGEKINYEKAIVFPKLPYLRISHFWEKVKAIEYHHTPIIAKPALEEEITKLFIKARFPFPNIANLKMTWEEAQNPVLREIYRIMPDAKTSIKKIIIYPTLFGSGVSFCVPKKFPAVVRMYLREDQNIYTIAEAIISSLTRNDVFTKLQGSWSESEIIADWLVSYSSLNQILKRYQPVTSYSPTLKNIRFLQKGTLVKQSEGFYKQLGLSNKTNSFAIVFGVPVLYNKPIKLLTSREKAILTRFINLQGQLFTYDEIAQMIFTNEDDFSLYVIAKIIQSLRNKLEKNGISGTYIQTIRGKGYLLSG